MNPRYFLVALLVVAVGDGVFEGITLSHGRALPNAYNLVIGALFAICVYLWYYFDTSERKYKRTLALGGFMILFAAFAAPYYLAKSRPKGERAKSFAWFAGFVVLLVTIMVVVPMLF